MQETYQEVQMCTKIKSFDIVTDLLQQNCLK